MFKRDIKLFIADIDDSIKAIEEFTNDIGYEYFVGDRKTYSATLREFIVIGEAIAHIPDDVKERFPDIEWRLRLPLYVLLHKIEVVICAAFTPFTSIDSWH